MLSSLSNLYSQAPANMLFVKSSVDMYLAGSSWSMTLTSSILGIG